MFSCCVAPFNISYVRGSFDKRLASAETNSFFRNNFVRKNSIQPCVIDQRPMNMRHQKPLSCS
jgi:hypothetical protein